MCPGYSHIHKVFTSTSSGGAGVGGRPIGINNSDAGALRGRESFATLVVIKLNVIVADAAGVFAGTPPTDEAAGT